MQHRNPLLPPAGSSREFPVRWGDGGQQKAEGTDSVQKSFPQEVGGMETARGHLALGHLCPALRMQRMNCQPILINSPPANGFSRWISKLSLTLG